MLLAGTDVVSHLLDYWILGPWFTGHHALLILVSLLMVLVFRRAARRIQTTPRRTGLLALLEVGLVFVRDDIVYPWLGEKEGRSFVPFFWTLFFFILTCNLLGLVPWPLNYWHRTATGNVFMTGGLAAIAFVTIQVSGMKAHGYGGYWVHLVPGGVPKFLWPLVWVIEFFGLLTKPFALMVRLFANMTAGHAIVAVLTGFMMGVTHYGNAAIGGAVSVASFGFWLFMMLFETLVALIQAYIFTVLTAIFVSLAVAHEH